MQGGLISCMTGLMMDYPLTLSHILEQSAKIYPLQGNRQPLVADGSMQRPSTYRDFHLRVHQLAHVLASLGIVAGESRGSIVLEQLSATWNSTSEFLAWELCCTR